MADAGDGGADPTSRAGSGPATPRSEVSLSSSARGRKRPRTGEDALALVLHDGRSVLERPEHGVLSKYWRPPGRAQYNLLPQEALVDVVVQRDAMIKALREQLRTKSALCGSGSGSVASLSVAPADDGQVEWNIQHIGNKLAVGRKSNHLTLQSVIVVGIRRNLANVSAGNMSCAIMQDINR